MSSERKQPPGRPAADGATKVIRVNISLTERHHQRAKQLAGTDGVSAWLRQAIDKAWKERK